MRWFASLVLALALGVMGCNETSGTGGFPCTEQGIRDAIAEGGGPHEFACNAPTVVPEYFRIRNDVILDGGGLLTTDGWDIASGVSAELHDSRSNGPCGWGWGDQRGNAPDPR